MCIFYERRIHYQNHITMKTGKIFFMSFFTLAALSLVYLTYATVEYGRTEKPRLGNFPILEARFAQKTDPVSWKFKSAGEVKPMPEYLIKGLQWLAEAQAPNGGWGAGQHAAQDIRDPHAVSVDPATTAFVGMALLRSGSTPLEGMYHEQLSKAVRYLLEVVDKAPADHINLTDLTGTQPQQKLGQNIDVAMTAQFFSRLIPYIQNDQALSAQVNKALDFCVSRLQNTQLADGSWNTAGWAPVLNSAMANNALELAQEAGRPIDEVKLDASRNYQAGNIDTRSGEVTSGSAAGISLYAVASSQRATAKKAYEAEQILEKAPADTKPVTEEDAQVRLESQGISKREAKDLAKAYVTNQVAAGKLQDDDVLSGFGNNGGEEFLSYMMSSESLVSSGGKPWDEWHHKMSNLFSAIQNPNGSWSGHHCITSPVFCTAAVVMTLTADRNPETK